VKELTTIAVDLAKSVFEVAVSEVPGRVSLRKRLSRAGLVAFLANHPPAVVLMEACGSAHHWGREIVKMGHEVRLLPPAKSAKYRIGNKTDRTDTDALLEANRNERILPVPVKTIAQQTLASVHRLRVGWMGTRTARLNALRGVMRELGVAIPVGAKVVLPGVADAMARGQIPEDLHPLLQASMAEIRQLEENVKACERTLARIARSIPAAKVLQEVPGIGLLGSTALIPAVGDPNRFRSGRKMSAFFGIVPREHSSGSRRRLGSITKKGNTYVRTLVIHGGRSVLLAAHRRKNPDRLHRWALEVERRQGANRAAVAVANKILRIAWAVWTRGIPYDGSLNSPSPKPSVTNTTTPQSTGAF
jgi:transposase